MELITGEKIEPLGKKATSFFEQIVEGFRDSLNSDRKDGTGLVFQPYNIICMACQYFLDDGPGCCFFPVLSLIEMLKWDGEDYEVIFMGSEPRVVQAVGATSGVLLECSGDDERVLKAFSGFRDAAAIILGLLKSYNSQGQCNSVDYDSVDHMLSRSLGEYLAQDTTTTFQAPAPENSTSFKYRIVKFSRARALGDKPDLDGHPAPIPLLLVAKSLNAWFSHLLRKNLLHGFNLPIGYKGDAQSCAIFPFCGADESDASCPVCLAKMIVRSDPSLNSLEYFEGG